MPDAIRKRIVVIGAGPGGYVAAIRAAQLGADVTVVEKQHVGGVCLNEGCIPTKALLESARLLEAIDNAESFGVHAENVTFDWHAVQKNKESIVYQLQKGVSGLLRANHIKFIQGAARFTDEKNLLVSETTGSTQQLPFDAAIVATGSVPVMPPVPGIDKCLDSTAALNLPRLPESLFVMGGGVIGLEFASVFARFGVKVSVAEMQPQILPGMDAELVSLLHRKLLKSGIAIYTNAKVMSFENSEGRLQIDIEFDSQKTVLNAQNALACVGRRSYTKDLGLETAGIRLKKGCIEANDMLRTSNPNVYAIGDCNGKKLLAHAASEQGIIAAENIMGDRRSYDDASCPSCVYTFTELASVGLTEEQARAQGIACDVGKFPLSANGKAKIMHSEDGLVKIVIDQEYGTLLGVHILGPHASEMIGEGALALGMKASVEEIIATIHAHPTVYESIHEAAMSTRNIAIHTLNKI